MNHSQGRRAAPAARATLVAALAVLAAAAAGCGGNDSTADEQTTTRAEGRAVRATLKTPRGQAVLDKLPVVPATLQAAAKVRGSGEMSLGDFHQKISDDVAKVWRQAFADSGYRFKPARFVVVAPGQRARSVCNNHVVVANDPVGPFYCQADHSIFIPLTWMDRLIYRKYGDFAVAYAVAHEWGHAIQGQLGILQARNEGRLLTVQTETQADCFSGLWARTAYKRGLLEKGDIAEAIKVADLIGDADGTPETDPRAHGRSGLRMAWFMTGYRSGKFADCKTY